ncbi:hypothetical protein [Shewanella algae]|uniref:hypothetical protein n=1 Tax=Shewanella algae TaxID=38313 RepID=UPI0030072D63
MLTQERTPQQKADLAFAEYFSANFSLLSDHMQSLLAKACIREGRNPEAFIKVVISEMKADASSLWTLIPTMDASDYEIMQAHCVIEHKRCINLAGKYAGSGDYAIEQIWHAKSESYCKLAEVFAALVERVGGV